MSENGNRFLIFERIAALWKPPVFAHDEAKTRTAYRLQVVATIGILIALAYSLLWLFVIPEYTYRLVLVVPLVGVLILMLPLIHRGYVRAASSLLLGGSWLGITLIVVTAGGTRSPFFGFYMLVVMSAIIFSGWRSAILYATLTFIAGLAMVYLAHTGFISEPFATPMSAWLTQASIIVFVAVNGYIIIRDITRSFERVQSALLELKQAEAALRESEERFRLISSVTSDYTFSVKLDKHDQHQHVLLTGAFEQITGYTPIEYRELGGWRKILHPDDIEIDKRDFEKLNLNQKTTKEVRIIAKSGDIRWVRVYTQPIWDDMQNRLIGFNSGAQDITERKRIETELVKREELYRLFTELATDYTFTLSMSFLWFTSQLS